MKTYAVYVSGKATRIRKAILKYNELANAIKCVISDEAFDIELQDFFSLYNIAYYAFDYNEKEKNTVCQHNYFWSRSDGLLCSIYFQAATAQNGYECSDSRFYLDYNYYHKSAVLWISVPV